MTLITDENGEAATGTDVLPYGTYLVLETKAPTGYLIENDANPSVTGIAEIVTVHTVITDKVEYSNLTQQHLANKLNCDSQLISSWETCRRRIPESRYKELSVALDIPLDKILELAKTEHIMNIIFS